MKDLRITYVLDSGIETQFEKELDALAVKYGMHRWASGCELQTRKRDITYDLARDAPYAT